MRYDRRKHEGANNRFNFDNYHQLVMLEKRRCERYNHFFTILGVGIEDNRGFDIPSILQSHMRSCDYIFELKQDDLNVFVEHKFGLLLPEAGAQEAASVRTRLQQVLHLCGLNGFIGTAIYPEHGTITDQLLYQAFDVMNWKAFAET